MILQPARIVVIDDNELHLRALDKAICELGSACLSFLYVDDHPRAVQLVGARLIFCDLHLGGDTLTTDKKAYHANIVSILAETILAEHGPYLLIVWSQYSDDIDGLKEYLEELPLWQRPFSVTCLDKNAFIDTESGDARKDADLPAAIDQIINSKPGLSAMLDWEQMVAQGASRTTTTLWNLCSGQKEDEQDQVLRSTLARLSIGGAGPTVARENPGHSIREALVPLLMDQLGTSVVDSELWARAVLFDSMETSVPSSQLYTALHFEMPAQFSPLTRGVASSLPDSWNNPRAFKERFGFAPTAVIGTCGYQGKNLEYAVTEASWYLVQINAACDDGRDAPGYLPYCLGATIPTTRSENNKEVTLKINGKNKASVEQSRKLVIDGQTVWLFLFGRFISGLRPDEGEALTPVFRVRSVLLDKLILEIRYNSARLGVVEP